MKEIVLYEIKKRFPNTEVLCLCKTGSSLFCTNPQDIDIIAICDNIKFTHYFFKIPELNIDVFCYNKISAFKVASGRPYGLSFALAKGDNLLHGKLPFEDYSWKKYQKMILKSEYDHFRTIPLHRAKKLGVCDKNLIWPFATYFACINNTLDFTSEQQEILQKCHDKMLSGNYAEKLKNNIEKLLKGV